MASLPHDRKLFAGPRLRRLRLQLALTQSRMAEDLGVSVSYLNLIERNQRPLTAAVLLRLSHAYNLDLRQLTGDDAERAADEVRQMLADPLLRGIDVGRAEIHDFVDSTPGMAQALARLYGAWRDRALPPTESGDRADAGLGPIEAVRVFIQDRRNHFPDLDSRAEALADELRLAPGGLNAALAERLRVRHGLGVRILPVDVMPDYLRRLDYHGRQLQLSELLDEPSRTFAAAYHIGLIEAKAEIEALVAAQLADKTAGRLLTQNLASYFAAAVMMPYARFHAAAESTGYDVELLSRRFGAGFEQVAHRLTTLQRPGSRGVPFFLIRVDRAGNVSKRFAAGRFPFATYGGTCPLWSVHGTFDKPGELLTQVIEMEDGARYLSVARTVHPQAAPFGATRPQFAVALGCELSHAHGLVYSRGIDLDAPGVTLIGVTCSLCDRIECRQRSDSPASRRLIVDERSRSQSPFRFAEASTV